MFVCGCACKVEVYVLTGKESIESAERIGETTSIGTRLPGEETNEYRTKVHQRCDSDSS